MNKIKERDARTKKRQKAKNKFDKRISLALDTFGGHFCTLALSHSEGKVRLLDEGAIVTASGKLDIYIEKGALKKYVQGKNKVLTPRYLAGDRAEEFFENPDEPMNIDDKYEGTINIGHQDFSTFPFIVGTWGQSDLTVADNGDGRKGLDVELKLNEAHPLVQALRVQDIPVGVSVEMYLHEDAKGTEEIQKKVSQDDQYWGMAIAADEIFIKDFAIVGECGNVGSSGSVDLQGVNMDKVVESTLDEAMLEEAEAESVEDTEEETTEVAEEAEVETSEETEEAVEEESENEEEEEEPEDESVEEVETDEAESEEGDDEEDALTVAEETIESLKKENASLNEQITALKASIRKKDKKIKEYAEKSAEFKSKYSGLSVSLGVAGETKEKVTTHKLYATGDGIGE